MLFTAYDRTDDKPKTKRESDFAFLDRSARPEMQRVRELLDRLIEGYPASEQNELIARFRSRNSVDFRSATFELIIYSFLVRLGYTLSPHPALTNGSTKLPDFHVVAPDGTEFYLEAVLASPNDGSSHAADAMIATALDSLHQSSHDFFYVEISTEGSPTSQPSGKKLLATALRWLDSLDPDHIVKLFDENGFDGLPTLIWEHEQLRVMLRPIPIRTEKRGMATTLIGFVDGEAGIVDDWTPIRDQIKFKGRRYGDLGMPLLVAVNFGSFNLDKIDEMQALYGQEEFVFQRDDLGAAPKMRRAPNGVWRGPKGPQGRRASGAWIFNDLQSHNITSRRQTIYFNPWAFHQLPDCLNQMPHARLHGELVRWEHGVGLKDVLELSEDWP